MGMLILALGLTLNTQTGLGVSPIISIAYCVSELTNFNFGDMTFLLYTAFVIIQLFLRDRKEWVQTLLQLPLSLVFSRVLNIYEKWIRYDSSAHSLTQNLLFLLAAILITGVGIALTVNMNLIPNPGDGIVQAVSRKIGKDQGFSKNLFDLGCVLITVLLGLLAAGRVIGIGLGTVVAMLGVGRAVALANHVWKQPMCRAAGLE